MNWRRTVVLLLVVLVAVSRMAHRDLLWVEEAYGMAAGAEMLRGKLLYRDIWFDKPPLYAAFYAAFGATAGLPLRLAGIALVLFSAWLVYRLGRQLWGADEGIVAGGLTGFALVFWIPSAVMPAAPDLLMLGPQVLAVYLSVRGRAFAAGLVGGVAMLCNVKAVFLVPVCALWLFRSMPQFAAGWVIPQAIAFVWMPVGEYWQQVWSWGMRYSADTFVASPAVEGLRRTANWLGFHAALVVGSAVCIWKEKNWRLCAWVAVSVMAVIAGFRFFPRYYFHLLPAMAVLGARGILLLRPRMRIAVLGLLLIPMLRFGPRYVSLLAGESAGWADVAMMDDSRRVGERLRRSSRPEETLLVWGYRPEVFLFSGRAAGTRFLDSQPLTGVLADRHLVSSAASAPDVARENRAAVVKSQPTFIVDGLGVINPALDIRRYEDLGGWLGRYEEVWETPLSRVYRLRR